MSRPLDLDDRGRPFLSASQYKTFLGCEAQWGARYLARIEFPQDPKAEEGTRIHKQMEDWGREAKLPRHPLAQEFMAYCPPPKLWRPEIAFNIVTAATTWRGSIDGGWDEWLGQILPLFTSDLTIGLDWKSTSDVKWAMTPDELLVDPAANLYAEALYRLGARAVDLRWVYGRRSKPFTVKAPVVVSMPRARCEDFVLGKMEPVARRMQILYQEKPDWNSLPKNTKHCYKFNRPCAVLEQCRPEKREFDFGSLNMVDFKASMQAAAGGAPPPPPPPPPMIKSVKDIDGDHLRYEAAPPPPPPPPAEFVPGPGPSKEPEQGIINPPGYVPGGKAPATPEEAAELQGDHVPVATKYEDDLTNLSFEELRVIADGFSISSKVRKADSLRDRIRQARAAQSAPPPPAPEAPVPPPAPENYMTDPVEPAAALTPTNYPIAVLMVNAHQVGGIPDSVRFVHLSELVVLSNQKVSAAMKKLGEDISDYRQMEYGKGPAALAAMAKEVIHELRASAPNDLIVQIDTRTPEGSVMYNALCSLTALVIQGS